MDASTELAKMEEQRAHAAARLDAVEREARAAGQAAEEASLQLSEAERHGASASKRHQLEAELAKAQARRAEPWAERLKGAQHALRDIDSAIRQHVTENFAEAAAPIEQDGEVAAQQVNEALAALIAACDTRRLVESRLAGLAVKVTGATLQPGDVARPRTDEVARAARALLDAGGEAPVKLRRDRGPWARLLGEQEPEPAEVEPAPV
jgi:hypothetical protein